jgi:hypothetical protein
MFSQNSENILNINEFPEPNLQFSGKKRKRSEEEPVFDINAELKEEDMLCVLEDINDFGLSYFYDTYTPTGVAEMNDLEKMKLNHRIMSNSRWNVKKKESSAPLKIVKSEALLYREKALKQVVLKDRIKVSISYEDKCFGEQDRLIVKYSEFGVDYVRLSIVKFLEVCSVFKNNKLCYNIVDDSACLKLKIFKVDSPLLALINNKVGIVEYDGNTYYLLHRNNLDSEISQFDFFIVKADETALSTQEKVKPMEQSSLDNLFDLSELEENEPIDYNSIHLKLQDELNNVTREYEKYKTELNRTFTERNDIKFVEDLKKLSPDIRKQKLDPLLTTEVKFRKQLDDLQDKNRNKTLELDVLEKELAIYDTLKLYQECGEINRQVISAKISLEKLDESINEKQIVINNLKENLDLIISRNNNKKNTDNYNYSCLTCCERPRTIIYEDCLHSDYCEVCFNTIQKKVKIGNLKKECPVKCNACNSRTEKFIKGKIFQK